MKGREAGKMRTWVEYGRVAPQFNQETGGVDMQFTVEGNFWAEKIAASGWEQSNLVATVDGIDVSDDISKLRTWAGHNLTTAYRLRIDGTMYSILSLNTSTDERMLELRIVSGLRDSNG